MPRKQIDQTNRQGGRSFTLTGGLTAFNVGDEIRGKFLRLKDVEINDRNTGERKTIRVYTIKVSDTEIARIGSRVLLDDLFDEVCAEYGGIEKLTGKDVLFVRGEDVETSGGNTLGTYEIVVF